MLDNNIYSLKKENKIHIYTQMYKNISGCIVYYPNNKCIKKRYEQEFCPDIPYSGFYFLPDTEPKDVPIASLREVLTKRNEKNQPIFLFDYDE